jgi:hypothetical protein
MKQTLDFKIRLFFEITYYSINILILMNLWYDVFFRRDKLILVPLQIAKPDSSINF